MHVSCLVTPGDDAVDNITLAEQLGYERAWVADGPALWGDMWMTLARAADRTERIGLGTGVIVPGYRHVMTTAAAVASLARLAPGRVALAVGPGLGQRMIGKPATPWKRVVEYIEALRALLRGEETAWDGAVVKMMHGPGAVADRPLEIPIYVPAEGPKGVEVAQRVADGILSFFHPKPGFDTAAVLLFGTVLADGPPDPQHILDAAGAGAGFIYHVTYVVGGVAVDELPDGKLYREAIEAHPEERRHLAIWPQHVSGMTEEERAVLTPERVEQLTFTGTASVLRERLAALRAEGATEIIYLPAGPDKAGELRSFAAMAGLG
jgi:5,10-methylenetetrahydromethanopterin reductase